METVETPETTQLLSRDAHNNVLLPEFVVPSMTGLELIELLESKGFQVGRLLRSVVLSSEEFKRYAGLTVQPVFIDGQSFPRYMRTMKNIRSRAKDCDYLTPSVEVVMYMLAEFDFDDTAVDYLVGMHVPVCSSNGDSKLLRMDCSEDKRQLDMVPFAWEQTLEADGGFLFYKS